MSVSSNILKEKSRNLLREEEPCYDEIESLMDDDDDEDFPTTSIRVLMVDADPNSLLLMKNLMTQFSYQVTNYNNGEDAIAFLMKNKHGIDLVLWDYHMPKINGLEALKTIGKEMDLPVVIMSRDHKKDTVKKSTMYGACDFLLKPVSKEVTAVLWRHVFHKRMMSKSGLGKSVGSDSGGLIGQDNDELYQSNEEGSKNVEDSVEQNTSDQIGEKSSLKKRRMSWTPELHHKFEVAVEKLSSLEKVYPKQILKCMQEEMNVEGLTRNNVASHLQRLRWQKYRLNADKKTHVPQETQEDSDWRNAGPNAALAASKPLLNSGINLQTGVRYFVNDQAAANAPIQCPSSGYLTMNNSHLMTNPLANVPYNIDPFYQLEQQQQYYPSLQFPSVISKQEHGHVSSAMENSDLISYQDLPYDLHECFPPGYNNFDQNARY